MAFQTSLLDNSMSALGGARTKAFLAEVDEMTPWEIMEKAINEAGIYSQDNSRGGRPPIPLRAKLRCFFLQKWFNLSDPMLEEMLNDRISFRQFVGLSQMERGIDSTTMADFRKRLNEAGLAEKLFDLVNEELSERGMILKEGSIVDSKIVKCSTGKKKPGGGKTADPTATHTKKHGSIYHGHKLHIATDKHGMIKEVGYSTAKMHDSAMADEMFRNEEDEALGDSAYASKEREEALRERGVDPLFIVQRRAGKELTDEQKAHNRAISKIRVAVECTFARLNKTGLLDKARYRGLRRNAQHMSYAAMCHNIVNAASMKRRGVVG